MLNVFVCLRCGHEWASRLPKPPRWCPSCHSEVWDKQKPPQSEAPPRPGKTPRKYPLDQIEVGQSITISWFSLPDGSPDARKNGNIGRAVRQEEVRYGKQFRTEPSPRGLRITRIA